MTCTFDWLALYCLVSLSSDFSSTPFIACQNVMSTGPLAEGEGVDGQCGSLSSGVVVVVGGRVVVAPGARVGGTVASE